eukprot:TRINITY_DN1351_c0_g1_i1.p1 TRINITY_DN1351_c0_g1~~TRINITY_DN1351_c0_g1_i1.p1  ORF type:complete len:601 (+),score=126.93 TRINITY_DN1351_c0_g1_i1:87-1805(+)
MPSFMGGQQATTSDLSAHGVQAQMQGRAGKGVENGNGCGGDSGGSSRTVLYFASLPNNWDDNEIKAFHQDIGCNAADIIGCKLLPRRQGLNSRAAIVRYASHAAAAHALQLCRGINQGTSGSMEVRFAEERQDKAGKGGGKSFEQGKSGSRGKDGSVPVTVGLRVRNRGNGQTGQVVACCGRTPGTFRVLFDNGQEWEWEVQRFESESGWPLLDMEATPATIGMRVRCWMDGRTGTIAYIHNDWPQRIWVHFDDGGEGEKDATWFVSEEGSIPVGPGLSPSEWKQSGGKASWEYSQGSSKGSGGYGKGGKSSAQDYGWAEGWEESNGKGRSSWHWQDPGHSNARWQDAWWEEEDYGKAHGKGYRSRGEDYWQADAQWKSSSAGQKSKGKGRSKPAGSHPELEAEAMEEVVAQLRDESNAGRVWIDDWPNRFQAKLGQLRDFLERYPDKFTVTQQGNGRRYTVSFASSSPLQTAHKEKKPKEKSLQWRKAKPADAAADAADVAAGGTSKPPVPPEPPQPPQPPRGPRRGNDDEDLDATAFDAPENEDSDDPVEDAMRSREEDDRKNEQAQAAA